MEIDAKIRHQKYVLFFSGVAVLVFCLWSSLKILIALTIHPYDWTSLIDDPLDPSISPFIFNLICYGIMAFIILFDGLIRFYIGRSAMRDSAGKKKRPIYIIITALYFLLTIYSSINGLGKLISDENPQILKMMPEQTITTAIIDLTAELASLMIIITGLRLRWLKRKLKGKVKE